MRSIYCIAFLFVITSLFSQNFDQVQIKTTQVSDQIYMLEGSGGNIAISSGKDGILMIDSQYAPLSEKIKKAIQDISDGEIKFLLNTHWHGDHVGGNENFAQMGAMIIAHENVKERMSKKQLMRAFSREIPASPEMARPVITFSDEMDIKINDEYLMMVHVDNAHTDGDALVYFPESNVLHMGDTYFQGRYPFIDLSSGGSVDGLLNAVNTALFITDADTKIIPGHGALSNARELAEYRDVIQEIRDKVKRAIKDGKSLDTVKAMKPGAPYDEDWGSGFISPDRFVDIVYSSLSPDE